MNYKTLNDHATLSLQQLTSSFILFKTIPQRLTFVYTSVFEFFPTHFVPKVDLDHLLWLTFFTTIHHH